MDIKVGGFEIQPGNGISLDELYGFMSLKSNQELENKYLSFFSDETYLYGLYMQIRNMRTFLKRKHEENGFIVKPEIINDGENFVVINFFIICKQTGRGLYPYYYGSSTVNQFCVFLSNLYTKLKRNKIANDIALLNKDLKEKAREKQIKSINKKYSGNLTYNVIERKESFVQRISLLKEIKSLSFDYMQIDPNVDEFKPLSDLAKRINHSVIFKSPGDNKWSRIRAAVTSIINRDNSANFKIKGIDPDGNEVIYKMFHDYDVFERADYDDFTQRIVIDFNDINNSIKESPLIKFLQEIKNRPQITSILEMNIS